jgi:hypothetical protein
LAEDSFRKESLKLWRQALNSIFPKGIPATSKWTDISRMSAVLTVLGSLANSNHMFYPTGGGMDLEGAAPYEEESGCLALKVGDRVLEVVKPTALLFESFGDDLNWAYFRLECEPLLDSGAYDTPQGESEEVVLVAPGEKYAPRSTWDNDEHAGKRLTKAARLVVRSTGGGPFVIFSKGSTYNFGNSDTYDARHAKVDAAKFAAYIRRAADAS